MCLRCSHCLIAVSILFPWQILSVVCFTTAVAEIKKCNFSGRLIRTERPNVFLRALDCGDYSWLLIPQKLQRVRGDKLLGAAARRRVILLKSDTSN